MKTLERHNQQYYERVLERERQRMNQPIGLACECSEELVCPDPRARGNPPKVKVECPACGYEGYMLI